MVQCSSAKIVRYKGVFLLKGCDLKTYKIKDLELSTNVGSSRRIELTHRYTYNVRYSEKDTCMGEFTAEVTDKASPAAIKIKITVIAIFEIDGRLPREEVHIITYNTMFPYVQSAISTVTAAAGIPPVIIPYIDASNGEILRLELPDLE